MSDAIHAYLCRAGPCSAASVQAALGLSKSSFQRAVSGDKRLLVVGRARATRYAARRSIDGLITPVQVYEVDPTGEARHALTLHPVEPFGCYVESMVPQVEGGFFEVDPRDMGTDPALDLPWFLQDLKPAGYLGRAAVRAHLAEGYPADLVRWNGDHVLRYLALHGADATGAFVVGPFALGQLRGSYRGDDVIQTGAEPEAFVERAQRVSREAPWGSSPGGEQPKFTATVRGQDGVKRALIVKFSPPMDTPGGRRWADLLVVEHLAHQVLRDHGVDAARSSVVDGGGRRFLAVERFDRVGERGRQGLVSLLPFDRSGVASELRRWSLVSEPLVAKGILAQADHERVLWLEAFGSLIANTDMHLGNLSLRLHGTTVLGLAPVYDMLPMAHAPGHGGELPTRAYRPEVEGLPASAREAALDLWARVLRRDDVSADYKLIAQDLAASIP